MRKKKWYEWFYWGNNGSKVIISILIAFVIFNTLNAKEKFNPETDVCLLFELTIPSSRCIHYLSIEDDKNYNRCIEERAKCIQWLPKTQCKLGNESWIEDIIPARFDFHGSDACGNLFSFRNITEKEYDKYLDERIKNSNKTKSCGGGAGYQKVQPEQTICREKTQQELNQDYCNTHQMDSKRCECKESKMAWQLNPYLTDYRIMAILGNLQQNGKYNKEELLQKLDRYGYFPCVFYINKTRYFINEFGKKNILIEQEKIERDYFCYYDYGKRVYIKDYNHDGEFTEQNICLKAIPK